jgi:hypothetical protein
MQEKVEYERERHLHEYERMSAELRAWIPAVDSLLSDTTWPANEDDAKLYNIAAATDMSSALVLPTEPYLATKFSVQHEEFPKFWNLMKWRHSGHITYGSIQDLVSIQLQWMETQPVAEDGWFLLLLKVYLEKQLPYWSSVRSSVRVTMLLAFIWQLSNVFEARGLSKIFDGETDTSTIRAIESAALIGLLPFVIFARMRSALGLKNDLPAGFEKDVEGRTLRDYLIYLLFQLPVLSLRVSLTRSCSLYGAPSTHMSSMRTMTRPAL